MTVSIGRVGYSAPTLTDPQQVRFDGELLRLSGITQASTTALSVVLRDQIRGLADNVDEPVVPIVFSSSTYASYSGMYRIISAASDMPAGDADNKFVRWDVAATRVGSYQQPFSESRCVVACLANSHSITTTNAAGEVGAPTPATEVYPNNSANFDSGGTITGADGVVYVAGLKTSVYTGLTSPAIFRWSAPVANWYIGGCRVQVAGDYVVGRQCVDSPTSWQIDNGLVKISASATAGAFDVAWYDGSQWDTAKTFAIFGNTVAGTISAFHHVGVLRNGIEAATIRLGLSNPGGVTAFADVTVTRGSRWVKVVVQSEIYDTWGVKRTSVEAATSLTGGIRATANDAAGNRYLLTCTGYGGGHGTTGTTNDLVNGSVRRSVIVSRALLGIGCEVGGSGAASPFNAATQMYRFYGQAFETARVVGR